MSKERTQFVCRDCGSVASKWAGQCLDCKAWNSIEEMVVEKTPTRLSGYSGTAGN